MVSAPGAAAAEGPAVRGLGRARCRSDGGGVSGVRGGGAIPALAVSLGHVAPSGPEACGGGEGLARLLRSETPPSLTTRLHLTSPARRGCPGPRGVGGWFW